MKKRVFFLIISFAVLCVSGPLLAHHGVAPYDTSTIVSVQGAVSEFQFINPHVLISVDVKNDKGESEKWVGEAQSPPMLVRNGWSKNTLKIGDVITVSGYRTKNGTNFLRLEKIVLPDGKELANL